MRYVFLFVAVVFLGLAARYLPKEAVHHYAMFKRSGLKEAMISSQPGSEEYIDRFARWFSDRWDMDVTKIAPWRAMRSVLPQGLKPHDGPTQFLEMSGYCSQLVRAARWALDGRMEIAQHDIIAPDGGHSAFSVKNAEGRWVFLDPFFGLYFRNSDGMMSLTDVVDYVRSGGKLEDIGVHLRADADLRFYDDIAQSAHALRPDVMEVTIAFPVEDKEHWSIGALDGSYQDIVRASSKQRLTSHLYYLGARYTSTFRFTYVLPDDERTYVVRFHLTRPAVTEELPTFSTPPVVHGRTLTFHLPPEIRHLTADSRHLRSGTWYDIDQIKVMAVDKVAGES